MIRRLYGTLFVWSALASAALMFPWYYKNFWWSVENNFQPVYCEFFHPSRSFLSLGGWEEFWRITTYFALIGTAWVVFSIRLSRAVSHYPTKAILATSILALIASV